MTMIGSQEDKILSLCCVVHLFALPMHSITHIMAFDHSHNLYFTVKEMAKIVNNKQEQKVKIQTPIYCQVNKTTMGRSDWTALLP